MSFGSRARLSWVVFAAALLVLLSATSVDAQRRKKKKKFFSDFDPSSEFENKEEEPKEEQEEEQEEDEDEDVPEKNPFKDQDTADDDPDSSSAWYNDKDSGGRKKKKRRRKAKSDEDFLDLESDTGASDAESNTFLDLDGSGEPGTKKTKKRKKRRKRNPFLAIHMAIGPRLVIRPQQSVRPGWGFQVSPELIIKRLSIAATFDWSTWSDNEGGLTAKIITISGSATVGIALVKSAESRLVLRAGGVARLMRHGFFLGRESAGVDDFSILPVVGITAHQVFSDRLGAVGILEFTPAFGGKESVFSLSVGLSVLI